MAKNRIRWGIISTANINRRLIPPLREAERSELLAVASRGAEKAEQYAKIWGIPRAFGSYEALLKDPEIDAVYISLPNGFHKEWAIKAAEAGKHILCEKPLALTVADVDEMEAAAKANKVILQEAFMYRFHPQTHKLKQLLAEKVVGELKFIRASFRVELNRPDDVRFVPALGGGALWDVGSYPVSFSRKMAGQEPVEFAGSQFTGPSGVDLWFMGHMRFPSGVVAHFDCSFISPSFWEAELVGDKGRIYVSDPWRPTVLGREKIKITWEDREEVIFYEKPDPYLCEVEGMIAMILDKGASSMPIADSRGNVATINALYEAARKR
jgi:D-xylose 1-dehydrogenase (NADP+, D-xylono-1,5-lactone-forming)